MSGARRRSRDGTSPGSGRTEHDAAAVLRFDLFLVVSVATVLVVRASLALLGYPQVGGSELHIAHVLWGGLLMAVAVIAMAMLPGTRTKTLATLVGGIGFGLFIDEVGKFVSQDVDYFFEPAIAIMYGVFVSMYLVVRVLVRYRPLTDAGRVAIGAQALGDHALGQLDAPGRTRALEMLAEVRSNDALADEARLLSRALATAPPGRAGIDRWVTAVIDRARQALTAIISTARLLRLVLLLCLVQAASTVAGVAVAFAKSPGTADRRTLLDTGAPSVLSGALLVAGALAIVLRRYRRGLALLEAATLVNLLVTQFSVFVRSQWLGLLGFAFSLLTYLTLRLARQSPASAPVPVAQSSVSQRSSMRPRSTR